MAGDVVIGGSINQTGTLVVEVTRVGQESFLFQVARSIEEARSLPPRRPAARRPGAPLLRARGVGGRRAGLLVWTVVPSVVGDGPDWNRALLAGLAALVMGYPCALGMATPLATIRGGGEAAERGILMRSGEAFQLMGEVGTIVLDKTGTITRGQPSVHSVIPVDGSSEADVLAGAAAAEANSEHPLARAVEAAAHGHLGHRRAAQLLRKSPPPRPTFHRSLRGIRRR